MMRNLRNRVFAMLLLLVLASSLTPSVAAADDMTVQQGMDSSSSVNNLPRSTKTIYLTPLTGDDANSGENADNPVKTIEKAAELAGEGGTVIIGSTVTIDKKTDLSNLTLVRSEDMAGTLLHVISDLTLTNVIVDGNNTENVMPLANVRGEKGSYGNLVMNDGTVFMNSHGTPIRVFYDGKFTMNGGEIKNNEVTSWWGYAGAIDLDQCEVYLNGGEIKNNSSSIAGAVRVGGHGGYCTLNGTKIYGNTGGHGGAFFVQGMLNQTDAPSADANLIIKSGEVTGNTATTYGGAICAIYNGYETNISISGGVIKDNTCTKNPTASAVYLATTTTATGTCDFAVSGSPTIEGSIYLMQTPNKVSTIHVTGEFTPTSPLQLYSSALDESTPSVKYDEGVPVNPQSFASEHEGWGFSADGDGLVWCKLKTVSFASSDGNVIYDSVYANADGLVNAADAPSPTAQEGYSLVGWKLKGTADNDLWDFSHDKVTEDNMVLTAVWGLDAPKLTVDAKTTKLHEGSEGTFALVAEPTHQASNVTYTFTWKRDGVAIPGATDATLTTDEPGTYSVAVTASDGTLTSGVAESEEVVCTIEPHALVHHDAVNPTCTKPGNTEYWTCEVCGKIFSDDAGEHEITPDDTVILETGHSWDDDGHCTVCDAVDPDFTPAIIAGTDATWQKGSGKDLSFTSNAAYGDFLKVQVDGKDVDAANYTVEEGSTVVTLKASYLETLSVGKHALGIVSQTGTAETEFTIASAAQETLASTGDASTPLATPLLVLASALVGAGALVLRRSRS